MRESYILKAPNSKLSGKDKAAIVAKELGDFLGHYKRETELYTVFREESGMVPRHIFEEFIAFASDSGLLFSLDIFKNLTDKNPRMYKNKPWIGAISFADLEDVLTLQTKLYRCAHIFLGKVQIFLEYHS